MAATRYDSIAVTLHWLIGLGIIGMLALGWIMTDLPKDNPDRYALFQLHKSIGITILVLSVLRLVWRLVHPAPPLPNDMKDWEKFAAHATHVLFYVLIIAIPFSGWVIVSTSSLGLPTVLYGLIPWPHLPLLGDMENKESIRHLAGDAHELMGFLTAGLLVLHAGAAMKHHFINRDDVLLRMTPVFINAFLDRLRRWL